MTNGELRVDIARLTEQIRQIRVDQGLPPEPNRIEPFVSVPLSMVLIERLEPFLRIAIKYTSVLAADTVHRVDTEAFTQYREYAELLRCSEGLWCRWTASGYLWMLQLMEHINTADDDKIHLTEIVRKAFFCIEVMRHDTDQDRWEYEGGPVAVNAEVARLMDNPLAYQSEYAAALEQYKTIGEDDEIE